MMSRRLGPQDVDRGTKVQVYLNYTSDQTPWVTGTVIAYNDQPMVLIEQADGSHVWVNCSLRWQPPTPESVDTATESDGA